MSKPIHCLLATCLAFAAPGAESPVASPDPAAAGAEAGVRLKELVSIDGVRDNQLNGIGIVVGLEGTGDSGTATLRMLRAFLEKRRLRVEERDLKTESVAMVAVTADLPAFTRKGQRLPTRVSCIGDAESLKGGTLLQTFLVAQNGDVYAAAQGTVSIGGDGDAGPGLVATGRDHRNTRTVGQLAQGALVEREVPVTLLYGDSLRLVLEEPDFTTATRVANRVAEVFGSGRVTARDASLIALSFPEKPDDDELTRTIRTIEQLRVVPDQKARVVINLHTGTVVIGRDVRITEVAISHGGLSLQVLPRQIFRPDPDEPSTMREETVWTNPVTGIATPTAPAGIVAEPTDVPGGVTVVDGTTVRDLSNALNAIGARPKDMVAIFQALEQAGALHAELVVM